MPLLPAASIRRESEILHDLQQEPGPALGLINPDLYHARRRHVVVLLANFVSRAEVARKCLIICSELCEHFFRGHALVVVVLQALMAGDIAD